MASLKLTDVAGIGIVKAKLLESNGISNVADLINCSLDELCQVPGIKEASANILKLNAKQLLNNNEVSQSNEQTNENIQEKEINSIKAKVKDTKDKIKDKKKKQKGKGKDKKKKNKGKNKSKKANKEKQMTKKKKGQSCFCDL